MSLDLFPISRHYFLIPMRPYAPDEARRLALKLRKLAIIAEFDNRVRLVAPRGWVVGRIFVEEEVPDEIA